MASSKLLLHLLVCYVSLICFASSYDLSGASSPKKVSLGLYYESLCPYCSSFIVNHLTKLFEEDLISIVDLHLSPWGNTKLRSSSDNNVTAVCQVFSPPSFDLIKIKKKVFNFNNFKTKTLLLQHGAFECLLDTVEACAIDAWPKLVKSDDDEI